MDIRLKRLQLDQQSTKENHTLGFSHTEATEI